MTRFLSLVRAISLFVLVGIASSLCAQNFITFDVPDSTSTLPIAINERGQIVGSYVSATPDERFGNRTHGFLRERDGTIRIIDASPGFARYADTYATAINAGGRITGVAIDLQCGNCAEAFLRENDGSLTLFKGQPSGQAANLFSLQAPSFSTDKVPFYVTGATGTDINAAGQIVGVCALTCVGATEGFLRQRDGTITDFAVPSANVPPFRAFQTLPQAINELGQITGYANAQGVTFHGFLRQRNGTIITFDPLDSTGTYAQAINLLGEITGSYTTAVGGSHGFVRSRHGTIIAFDPPRSMGTEAHAINVEGQIVGSYLGSDGIYHSFIRGRNGRVTTFNAPGRSVLGTFARDINAQGQITGYYVDQSGTHGFVVRLHGICKPDVDE